jgi:hypothetical protein
LRADEITIVFCGSKKSLASGLPSRNRAVRGPCRNRRHPGDGVTSDSAHGLRRAGPALRGAPDRARSSCGSSCYASVEVT